MRAELIVLKYEAIIDVFVECEPMQPFHLNAALYITGLATTATLDSNINNLKSQQPTANQDTFTSTCVRATEEYQKHRLQNMSREFQWILQSTQLQPAPLFDNIANTSTATTTTATASKYCR